jgi:heptosyltransferase II
VKILVVRLSALGDVILATAAVEALMEDAPAATVHVLTKPAYREVFRHHPGIARLVEWAPEEGLWTLGARLRRERYDLIVDLHVNIRTHALRPMVPRPRWLRASKNTYARRAALWFHNPALLPGNHVVDRYVQVLGPAGVRPLRRKPKLYGTAAEDRDVRRILAAAGWDGATPLVALAPSARWESKAWPARHWRSLSQSLSSGSSSDSQVAGRPHAFPVLIGGPEDRALCEWVLGPEEGVVLAGQSSVRGSAAALALAHVLVTNDSAPMHMAQAVATPVVALFGPTVPEFGFFPLGSRDRLLQQQLPCRPCSLHGAGTCPLGHHRCLTDIAPGAVLAAVGEVMGGWPEPALAGPAGRFDEGRAVT